VLFFCARGLVLTLANLEFPLALFNGTCRFIMAVGDALDITGRCIVQLLCHTNTDRFPLLPLESRKCNNSHLPYIHIARPIAFLNQKEENIQPGGKWKQSAIV
jgi:hypothetical protein